MGQSILEKNSFDANLSARLGGSHIRGIENPRYSARSLTSARAAFKMLFPDPANWHLVLTASAGYMHDVSIAPAHAPTQNALVVISTLADH